MIKLSTVGIIKASLNLCHPSKSCAKMRPGNLYARRSVTVRNELPHRIRLRSALLGNVFYCYCLKPDDPCACNVTIVV